MTTWHAEDPLSEALWLLMNVAWPDKAFEDSCNSTIAICVGPADWTSQVRTAFSDPAAFTASVLASKTVDD
jgi:hypothetical protein